ncbi:MAG: EamA family transporter [Rhodobacteraceae bacterium]|nr:EamA family transporter [Paracoccaceae bacterium]
MQISLTAPSQRLASVAVFFSASLWGIYWIPLRSLEEHGIDGTIAAVLLNLPAAVILGLFTIWNWSRYRPTLKSALLIGSMAGLGLSLYTAGLVMTSVVRATMLFYLTPIWSTLIGIVWLGEQAGWRRWAGIACALIGLSLMLSGGSTVPLNVGDVFALASGVAWAVAAALINHRSDVPLISMTAIQFGFTALGTGLLGVLVGSSLADPAAIASALPYAASLSVLILLPAVVVLFWGQKFVSPGRVGLLMMSEALVAVLSAAWLLPEERMGLVAWIGAVMILGGFLIELQPPLRKPRSADPA